MNIKTVRVLLICSLLLNVLMGIYVGKRAYFILSGKSKMAGLECDEQCRYFKKILKFEMDKNEKDEIVFLGNSLTEYNDWSVMFGDQHLKNRGIEGDNTIGILKRLEEVLSSRPRKIFLEIGINDVLGYSHGYPLPENYGDERILTNYEEIIVQIKKQSPGTLLFLQNILPVSEERSRAGNYNERIKNLNQSLESLSKKYQCTYIDLYQGFEERGSLKRAFTYDGIHITKEGYEVWKKKIEKYVKD